MNYEKVKDQFGDWAPKFKPFIESSAFDEIFKFLKDQSRADKRICPESKDVFRAFRETPYKDLKVIFLLQDPYPWVKKVEGKDIMVADGIPMSCSNTGVCQPSLSLFYDGISDDLGIKVPHHPDLSYLCKQGVLFLNTSLTVEVNKPGSHKGVWDKFITFFIEEVINFYNTGTCYVSMGKNAEAMAKAVVPFLHWGFTVEHPAAAAHTERAWKHQNIFSKINKITKDTNLEVINWAYGQHNGQDTSRRFDVVDGDEIPSFGVRGKKIKQ